jgi:predicted amidophosphoribosyltransferase
VSNEPKLPSEIEFASFLVYNPSRERFPDAMSETSRRVMRAVKSETAQWARKHRLGERMGLELGDEIRARFLGSDVTLVPMPGHAPMKDARSHWAARELCEHFVAAGLGTRWLPLLERATRTVKAAGSRNEDRPSAEEHYGSFLVKPDLAATPCITVIDDVITRGATMLAAIARLAEAYPRATVRGFALLRTQTDQPIVTVKEPVVGRVIRVPWGTKRTP